MIGSIFGDDDPGDVDYGHAACVRDLAAMTEAEVIAAHPDDDTILLQWEEAKERVAIGAGVAQGYTLFINEWLDEQARRTA